MIHAVVCEDPSRRLAIGTVVEGVAEIAALRRKGVAVLPYDYELPRTAASVAYVQNFYGQGWLFDRGVGERGCPLVMHVTKECRYVYWALKIKPKDSAMPWSAQMRLVHSADNGRGLGRGMTQIDHLREAPVLDSDGTATVYGKAAFEASTEGLLFADIYAVARNALVLWTAATQHRGDFKWATV
jgi:hypothetical protein